MPQVPARPEGLPGVPVGPDVWIAEMTGQMGPWEPEHHIETPAQEYYSWLDTLFTPDLETLERIAQDFPQARQEIEYLGAVQAMSHRLNQMTYPDGAKDEDYERAMASLAEDVANEVNEEATSALAEIAERWVARDEKQPLKWFETPTGIEQEIKTRLAGREIKGVHSPPISPDDLDKMAKEYIRSGERGMLEEFRGKHPYVSTALQTAGGITQFIGALSAVRGGMKLAGLSNLAKKAPAVAGGVQMGAAEMLMQGAAMAVGEQEQMDFVRALETAVLGGLAHGVGHKVMNKLAAGREKALRKAIRGLGTDEAVEFAIIESLGKSAVLAQKWGARANLATFITGEEVIAQAKRIAKDEKDPELAGQKMLRWAIFTLLGAKIGGKHLQEGKSRFQAKMYEREAKKAKPVEYAEKGRARDAVPVQEAGKKARETKPFTAGEAVEFTRKGQTVTGKIKQVLPFGKGKREQFLVEVEGAEKPVLLREEMIRRPLTEAEKPVTKPTAVVKVEPKPALKGEVVGPSGVVRALPSGKVPKGLPAAVPVPRMFDTKRVSEMRAKGATDVELRDQLNVFLKQAISGARTKKGTFPGTNIPLTQVAQIRQAIAQPEFLAKMRRTLKIPLAESTAMLRKAIKTKARASYYDRGKWQPVRILNLDLSERMALVSLPGQQGKTKLVPVKHLALRPEQEAQIARGIKPPARIKLAYEVPSKNPALARAHATKATRRMERAHQRGQEAMEVLDALKASTDPGTPDRSTVSATRKSLGRAMRAVENAGQAPTITGSFNQLNRAIRDAAQAYRLLQNRQHNQGPRKRPPKGREREAGGGEMFTAMWDAPIRGIQAILRYLVRALRRLKEAWKTRPGSDIARTLSTLDHASDFRLNFFTKGKVGAKRFGPTERLLMRRKLLDETLKPVSTEAGWYKKDNAEPWESIRITFDDGTRLEAWDPDSRARFVELRRRISKMPYEDRPKEELKEAQLDRFLMWFGRGAQEGIRDQLSWVYNSMAYAFGGQPEKGMLKHFRNSLMDDFFLTMERSFFQDITNANRAELNKQNDKIKRASYDTRMLLRKLDPEGHLSDAMWAVTELGIELRAEDFGGQKDLIRANENIKALQESLAWAGTVFEAHGFITKENLERVEAGLYQPRLGAPRLTDKKPVYARAALDALGSTRVLSPGSVQHMMRTHFKGRSRTPQEHIAAGGRTEIAATVQGALQQVAVAGKLKLFERVAEEPSIFRWDKPGEEGAPDLPMGEMDARYFIDRAQQSYDAVRRYMVANRIPIDLLHGGPESIELREARGQAWQAYVKQYQKVKAMVLARRAKAHIQKAKEKLDRLSDRAFELTDFRRIEPIEEAVKKPGRRLRPAMSPEDPRAIKANRALQNALKRIREFSTWDHRWDKVSDDPAFGPLTRKVGLTHTKDTKKHKAGDPIIDKKTGEQKVEHRGGWIRRDVWNEVRMWEKETSALLSLWDTVTLLPKRNLTSRSYSVSMLNMFSNVGANASMGQYVSSPTTWYHTNIARKVIWDYKMKGKWEKTGDAEVDQVIQEFFDTGMVESTAAVIELVNLTGDSMQSWEKSMAAFKEKRSLDGMMLSVQSAAQAFDQYIIMKGSAGLAGLAAKAAKKAHFPQWAVNAIEKAHFGTHEDFYHAQDISQALSLTLTLRTGRGSKWGRKLTEGQAYSFMSMWYNYQQVHKILKTPLVRRLWNFSRFPWKAATGIPQALAGAPASLPPFGFMGVPHGLVQWGVGKAFGPKAEAAFARKTTFQPRQGKGKTLRAQKIRTLGSHGTLLSIKAGMWYLSWMMAQYFGRMLAGYTDEDEEEDRRGLKTWERLRRAAAGGDPWRDKFMIPVLAAPENPWFFEAWGVDPHSHIGVFTDERIRRDDFATSLFQRLMEKSILGGTAKMWLTGEGYFGEPLTAKEKLGKTLSLFVPGTLVKPLREIIKQSSGRTTKTPEQSLVDVFGFRLEQATEERALWADVEHFERKGEYDIKGFRLRLYNEDTTPDGARAFYALRRWIKEERARRDAEAFRKQQGGK